MLEKFQTVGCTFDLFDERGYSGWVGCEYRLKGETKAGLGWGRRCGCTSRRCLGLAKRVACCGQSPENLDRQAH